MLVFCSVVLGQLKVNAQSEMKFNLVGPAVSVVNVAYEVKLRDRIGLQFEVVGTFAENNFANSDYPFVGNFVYAEPRFYLKKNNTGPFVGITGGWGTYYMNKNVVLITNTSLPSKNRNDVGWGLTYGLTLGYKVNICKRLSMEVNGSAGRMAGNHMCLDMEEKRITKEFNGTGEWLIFKGGVFLSYRFGYGKK